MKSYFKGWYFKIHSREKTIAFIPAMHVDEKGNRSCSVQIITDDGAYCSRYSYDSFLENKHCLCITVADNKFSEDGMVLNIHDDDITIFGTLSFERFTPLKYDIMGPFRYVPLMECRHSVFSMTHSVNGYLQINGKTYNFKNDIGYIEGDRGKSFPKHYLWTQCNFFDKSPCSLMLSAADIPFMGRYFTGVIGVVYWHNHEYRIATYLGCKVINIGDKSITVQQGKYTLTAELISKQDKQLFAPVSGGMTRLIRESPVCHARYRFLEKDKVLFDFNTNYAGFEYEYDK